MPNDLVRYSGLVDDDSTVQHSRPTPEREDYETSPDDIDEAGDTVRDRWGRGDARTWAVIWAMFFGFLLFCWFVHSLPTGAHVNPPSIRVY